VSTSGGHERRDIDPGRVTRVGIAILAFLGFSMALSWGLTRGLVAWRTAASPAASPVAERLGPREPPAPRLQADPHADLEALRARDGRILGTYGWVDRDAGIARIPIARAMELLAGTEDDH
jgi:hypothetical protein